MIRESDPCLSWRELKDSLALMHFHGSGYLFLLAYEEAVRLVDVVALYI